LIALPNDTARVAFCHAALGSPPVTTLLAALRAKLLATLPIITAMVTQHPPNSAATTGGHLDAHRQHVQPSAHARTVDSICDFPPATEPVERHRHRDIFVKFLVPKDELDIDLADRLPIGDTWGDGAYHIVMYHYGANYVCVEPTPDRSHANLTAALERGLKFFADRNITSSFAVLDNKFNTQKFKNLMRRKNLPFQLVLLVVKIKNMSYR
jgi:hypothetical protein